MGISSWLYTNSAQKRVVKIVHPGGHAELHDRPVLAAEIIRRNPRCCVAHPHVFKQPWAIVAPETTLMPGQKFYVVPISTIRKLQKLALKYNPSLLQQVQTSPSSKVGENNGMDSPCCSLNTPNLYYDCLKSSDMEADHKQDPKGGKLLNESCFNCLTRRIRTKAGYEDSTKETNSEAHELTGKRTNNVGSSPERERRSSVDNWQPNLESIVEE